MPDIEVSRMRAHDQKLQAHRLSDNEYRVYNVVKGTSYSVLRDSAGVWHCTCPWNVKGSRMREGVCKHLARIQDKENGCGICGRKDAHADLKRVEVYEPLLCAVCRQTVKMLT